MSLSHVKYAFNVNTKMRVKKSHLALRHAIKIFSSLFIPVFDRKRVGKAIEL